MADAHPLLRTSRKALSDNLNTGVVIVKTMGAFRYYRKEGSDYGILSTLKHGTFFYTHILQHGICGHYLLSKHVGLFSLPAMHPAFLTRNTFILMPPTILKSIILLAPRPSFLL